MTSSEKKHPGEQEIDLLELANKLWQKKIFILKVCVIGMIAGVVIAFSIPKEYSTTVILAPEAKSTTSGNVGMLASMAGINLSPQTEDAISPELYPNIASSTPFLVGLFDVKVEDEKKGVNTDLYTYLEEEQSQAWWSYILGLPSKMIGLLSSKSEVDYKKINNPGEGQLQFSGKQTAILNNLKNRINVSVDKKTGVISLSSMMQSPEISAFIADTITSYLQKYIINYRTQKARNDLAFTEKLYEEAKADYDKAQQEYTTYTDRNQDIISARYGTTKEKLKNEMDLTLGVYNQMAQQLQMAKVKVQDTTPVYTIIQPAVVPLVPDKPKKKLIVIGFIFVGFIGACCWVLGKEFMKNSFNTK